MVQLNSALATPAVTPACPATLTVTPALGLGLGLRLVPGVTVGVAGVARALFSYTRFKP
jgi:hypothetical protein